MTKTLAGGKKVRGILQLYLDGINVFHGLVRHELIARLISLVRDLSTSNVNDFVRIRGGGIRLNDRTVVLPSVPQPRLPALLAHLVSDGAAFYGDEMLAIDPILRTVHGFDFPLLVDAEDASSIPGHTFERGGRRRAQQDEEGAARTARRPVLLTELSGRRAEPAGIDMIVFPVFDAALDEPFQTFDMGAAEKVFRLSESVLNLNVWTERALILSKEILAEVPSTGIVMRSPSDGAAAIARLAASDI